MQIKYDFKYILIILFFSFFSVVLVGEQRNIFLLHTNADSLPWTKDFKDGIYEVRKNRETVNIFSEDMDKSRLHDSMNDSDWYAYLSQKYSRINFDAVMATGGAASRFINTYGQELFGKIPKILQTYERLEQKPNTYYFENQQSTAVVKTFQMAIDQNPHRDTLVIINSHSKMYIENKESIQQFASKNNLDIRELNDHSSYELVHSIENLQGNEILFYFLFSSDNSDTSYTPQEFLRKISVISPSPIYTFWSSLLDTGCAGGVMVDSRTIAREMCNAIDDFYTSGDFKTTYQTIQAYTDWNAIKRYDLIIDDIPDDIIIVNQKTPVIKLYYSQIMTATSIIFALFFSLALYSRFRLNVAGKNLKSAIDYQSKLIEQQEILKNDLIESGKLSSLGMMVAGIAHELKTPAGAAMLLTTQLVNKLKTLNQQLEAGLSRQDIITYIDETSKGLDILQKNHERALSLITSFKRLAYERSNEQVHTFLLVDAVKDLIETVSPQIKRLPISLSYDVPDDLSMKTVYGPLSQVLQNLVINSIEHAFNQGKKSKGKIIIEACEEENGTVLIKVKDNGSGIKPEIREKVLDPFVTSRRQFGNTGLGLHFVHQWVTNVLKGSLSIDSIPGKGTNVKIRIPKELPTNE